MLFTIMISACLSLPSTVAMDTNLTAWCEQEHISIAQIANEFAVLDSILAIERRQYALDSTRAAKNDSSAPHHFHGLGEDFGETVDHYNQMHGGRLPHTAIINNPDCRIFFAYQRRPMDPDTCPKLSASIYIISQMTNMPMVRAERCTWSGLTTYTYMTENGMLRYDQSGERIELWTYDGKVRQHFIIWMANSADTLPATTPLGLSPVDSLTTLPGRSSGEPR